MVSERVSYILEQQTSVQSQAEIFFIAKILMAET
jgi:hypothetical protein